MDPRLRSSGRRNLDHAVRLHDQRAGLTGLHGERGLHDTARLDRQTSERDRVHCRCHRRCGRGGGGTRLVLVAGEHDGQEPEDHDHGDGRVEVGRPLLLVRATTTGRRNPSNPFSALALCHGVRIYRVWGPLPSDAVIRDSRVRVEPVGTEGLEPSTRTV